MHVPLLALLLLLAAAPAGAGEVIRYRNPDGSIGFVDDEKRLPPGVEVLSRTPLDPPAPPPEPPPAAQPAADVAPESAASPSAPPPAAPASDHARAGDGEDCDALGDRIARMRCRNQRERLCNHFGLPSGCTLAQVDAARAWCARGEELRAELAPLGDRLDAAREELERCRRRTSLNRVCETLELDEAERAVRTGERRVQALEEQCQDEGCLPGWVREGCALEPRA
ncbi:MAG TPA: hypothetical protein VIN04_11890 [Myxococcota bacterium]